jgi:hypothetical protein
VKIIVDKRFQFGGEKGSQGSSSLTAKVFSCDRHLRDDIQSITTFSGAASKYPFLCDNDEKERLQ